MRLARPSQLSAVIWACLSIAAAGSGASRVFAADCLAGLRPALLAGGFSGANDCSAADISLRWIGATTGPIRFTVYDYRYKSRPSGGLMGQSGQSILIFTDGRYLGRYALNPPPFLQIRITGTELRAGAAGHWDSLLLEQQPPMQFHVAGDIASFGK